MSKGIYERKGKNGDITYYIRYQYQLTDIKERVGRKSREMTFCDIALAAFSKLAEKYREFAGGYKRGWESEKYIVEEFASLFGDMPLAQITT